MFIPWFWVHVAYWVVGGGFAGYLYAQKKYPKDRQ